MRKRLALIPLILGLCSNPTTGPGNISTGDEYAEDAKTMCAEFVADRLVSPSSADFLYQEVYHIKGRPHNHFYVKGQVDSQNRMSAMIRSKYGCELHHDFNGNWTLDDIEIED